jgi:hypothetical protein
MEARFGVNAASVEEAYKWVEQATGLQAEPRESSQLGGDYYAFYGPNGETIKLLSNRDLYDDEPVISGCDDWAIAVLVEGASKNSALVQGLLNDTEHFVAMKSS